MPQMSQNRMMKCHVAQETCCCHKVLNFVLCHGIPFGFFTMSDCPDPVFLREPAAWAPVFMFEPNVLNISLKQKKLGTDPPTAVLDLQQ